MTVNAIRSLSHRLHTGQAGFDFVGRRALWYGMSAVILLVAICGITFRGVHLGTEFKGGQVYTVSSTQHIDLDSTKNLITQVTGDRSAIVQATGNGQTRIQVSADYHAEPAKVVTALAKDLKVPQKDISAQVVGPSWGKEITHKAMLGLVIFMVLVTVYLAIAFEWRMALAALIALFHDLLITIGVYAILGFEVTPGTVIGFLTILGFSLYDTVVIFDGVKDSTKNLLRQDRLNYSQAANRALNATLIRSLNTTVLALLPVAALLFIGGGFLGAGTLNDISLALFVGLAAGAYSSICVATPILAQLKERQPEYRRLADRVAATKENPDGAHDTEKAGRVSDLV
ncbi:protein translocase subunit SecF [Streptomyces sp. NPDC059985]|uniref:protein translocase subunit SecF n=1 Tax=Streptomyces sp. NPDC059985 TaxID=3347025 RepID=UPI0036C6838B